MSERGTRTKPTTNRDNESSDVDTIRTGQDPIQSFLYLLTATGEDGIEYLVVAPDPVLIRVGSSEGYDAPTKRNARPIIS